MTESLHCPWCAAALPPVPLFTHIRYLCDACNRRFTLGNDGKLHCAGNGQVEPPKTKNPGKPAGPAQVKPILNLV